MKAEAKSLCFLGEYPQKLTIPFFQRGYVWETKNWEELLLCLTSKDSKPFLGSIIIKKIDAVNPTEAQVIDGQQRLTTLTILSKAIYDTLFLEIDELEGQKPDYDEDDDDKFGKSALKNYLFYKLNTADSFKKAKVKIQHSRVDREAYEALIKENFLGESQYYSKNYEEIDEESKSVSPILKCYKFFRKELKKMRIEDIIQLHNDMYDANKKMLVLISMDLDDDNEQSIFDTINRAGVRLSLADIIKNNLFKKMIDCCSEDFEQEQKVIELYEDKWEKIFYLQEDSTIWENKRTFGNNQRTNLEFLLYCVAFVNWGKKEDIFSDLANVYKNQTQNMNFDELNELVKQINIYATVFRDKVLSLQMKYKQEEEPLLFSYDDVEKRVLLVLEVLGVQMFYPYVLKLLVDENDKDELNKKLRILESFVVRRRLSSKGVSDYAIKCNTLLNSGERELLNDLKDSNGGLTNEDVLDYFVNIKTENAKLILFIIELYKRRDKMQDIRALAYAYSLEHIMPQKWQTHWLSVPLIDGNGKAFLDEDGKEITITSPRGQTIRKNHVSTLGNMTLLTQNLNASVKNSDYSKKIEGDGENKPGYRKFTSLIITKELVEAYDNNSIREWNESTIEIRTKELAKSFFEIWPDEF